MIALSKNLYVKARCAAKFKQERRNQAWGECGQDSATELSRLTCISIPVVGMLLM